MNGWIDAGDILTKDSTRIEIVRISIRALTGEAHIEIEVSTRTAKLFGTYTLQEVIARWPWILDPAIQEQG